MFAHNIISMNILPYIDQIKNNTLENLDLTDELLTTDQIILIADTLAINTSIRTLNLSGRCINKRACY